MWQYDVRIIGQRALALAHRYRVGELASITCRVDLESQTASRLEDILNRIGETPGPIFFTTPFTWTKDSVAIVEDSRISVDTSSTFSILFISNVQPSDAGEYTCSREGFPSVTTTLEVTNGMYDSIIIAIAIGT